MECLEKGFNTQVGTSHAPVNVVPSCPGRTQLATAGLSGGPIRFGHRQGPVWSNEETWSFDKLIPNQEWVSAVTF